MEKNINDVLWKAETWMVESLVLYVNLKCDPEGILRFRPRTSTSTSSGCTSSDPISDRNLVFLCLVRQQHPIRSSRVSRKPYPQSTIYKVQKLSKCCFFRMFLNCRSFPQCSVLDVCGVGAAAAAGERAAVTRSRQLAAPAHCTQLSTAAAGGGRGAHCSSCSWGGGGSLLQQLLGPGASAPTAASHQPTGENIILIPTQ